MKVECKTIMLKDKDNTKTSYIIFFKDFVDIEEVRKDIEEYKKSNSFEYFEDIITHLDCNYEIESVIAINEELTIIVS